MCGIVGVVSHAPVNQLIYDALLLLQHRGQEGCGIVSVNDAGALRRIKGEGLVTEVFNEANLRTPEGSMAVQHMSDILLRLLTMPGEREPMAAAALSAARPDAAARVVAVLEETA